MFAYGLTDTGTPIAWLNFLSSSEQIQRLNQTGLKHGGKGLV